MPLRILLGSAAAAALGCAPLSAWAQAGDDQGSAAVLEEIVVTAQKRTENMQDVPVAVTAISAQSLSVKGIETTTDLTSVTPGLNYTQVAGSALPRIRGVGTAISLGGMENPVATYVDGVYIASATASVLSFNNIEQIAVLKGPQGTLFGRNATGGLIQITTRDPQNEFQGQASVTYGNLNTVGGDLYLTAGLLPNLSADLALYYRDQQEGFGRNLVTGSDVNKSRDFAARTKWKLDLGEDTTVRFAADYAVTRAANPAFRAMKGTLPITGVRFTGGDFDIANEQDPRLQSEQWGVSLNVNHSLGWANLVSITAYRRSQFHAEFDIDKLPTFISRSDLRQPDRQFSQELQLISKDNETLTWVVGAYYFDGRGGYDPLVIRNVPNSIFINSSQGTESYAVFGQATYNLTDATSLTGGLRYTQETKDFTVQGQIVTAAGFRIVNPKITDSVDAEKVTWRLALNHDFTDDIMGYVSYNRGFKSGGFNPQRFQAPLNPFAPEVLDAVEVGVKSELLDRRVRLNAAAFYYDYQNIQINAFVQGISTIYNAASAEIYGLDFDLTAAVTDNFTLTAGLSVLHHRFGDFPGANISVPAVPNGTTVLGGNVVGAGNASGKRLPLTPDWTLSLGADYEIPLPAGSLLIAGNYFHSDGWRAEPDNRIGQEPYDLWNMSATWFVDPDKNRSVKLWGKNLTDEAYAIQMNAQPQADGVAVGPGRTFGVTLGAKF